MFKLWTRHWSNPSGKNSWTPVWRMAKKKKKPSQLVDCFLWLNMSCPPFKALNWVIELFVNVGGREYEVIPRVPLCCGIRSFLCRVHMEPTWSNQPHFVKRSAFSSLLSVSHFVSSLLSLSLPPSSFSLFLSTIAPVFTYLPVPLSLQRPVSVWPTLWT